MKIDFELSFRRGDTCAFRVPIKFKDGQVINLEDVETLYVTVKRLPERSCEKIFVKKLEDLTIDENGVHIKFEPNDTENLDYGTYFGDVEITTKSGVRKTIFFELQLTEETSSHGTESGDVSE